MRLRVSEVRWLKVEKDACPNMFRYILCYMILRRQDKMLDRKNKNKSWIRSTDDIFNEFLQIPEVEITWDFPFIPLDQLKIEEIVFIINPRRLRGSDFLMRWEQGRWAENIVLKSLNSTSKYGVIRYGPSTVAPTDPRELELFFEKMDELSKEGKRPDILLYDKANYEYALKEINQRISSVERIIEVSSSEIEDIINMAKVAIEVENSLWVTEKMPGFGKTPDKYTRGKRKGQLKFSGPVPTIIVKEEDIKPLQDWQNKYEIPIYVVHVFFDRAYFIKFDEIFDYLKSGLIGFEVQKYTNPDGTASTPKNILKIPYILCKEFGTVKNPKLVPKSFVDKNGKVMTYVTFEGGELILSKEVFKEWG